MRFLPMWNWLLETGSLTLQIYEKANTQHILTLTLSVSYILWCVDSLSHCSIVKRRYDQVVHQLSQRQWPSYRFPTAIFIWSQILLHFGGREACGWDPRSQALYRQNWKEPVIIQFSLLLTHMLVA